MHHWLKSFITTRKVLFLKNIINGAKCNNENKEIRDLFHQPNIVAVIKSQSIRWTKHILRRDNASLLRTVWNVEMDGRNPEERLNKTQVEKSWKDWTSLKKNFMTELFGGAKLTQQKSLDAFSSREVRRYYVWKLKLRVNISNGKNISYWII